MTLSSLEKKLKISKKALKSEGEIAYGINKWEQRIAGLEMRYNEKFSDPLRLAILVSMLPKEFQDLIWQKGTKGGKPLEYPEAREFVLSLAQNRVAQMKPVHMGVGGVEDEREEEQEGQDVDER